VSSRGDGERVKRRVILLYSRLIVAESAFHRGREREREREGGGGRRERGIGRERSDTLLLVEKIKARGILMDRGTRPFTLDQFSRMKRFSRNKRCIKACSRACDAHQKATGAIVRAAESGPSQEEGIRYKRQIKTDIPFSSSLRRISFPVMGNARYYQVRDSPLL